MRIGIDARPRHKQGMSGDIAECSVIPIFSH